MNTAEEKAAKYKPLVYHCNRYWDDQAAACGGQVRSALRGHLCQGHYGEAEGDEPYRRLLVDCSAHGDDCWGQVEFHSQPDYRVGSRIYLCKGHFDKLWRWKQPFNQGLAWREQGQDR